MSYQMNRKLVVMMERYHVWGVLRSRVLRVLYGIRGNVGVLRSEVLRVLYGKEVGVWSFAAMLSVFVVGVFGIRWQRWKTRVRSEANDRMMRLINQKDEVCLFYKYLSINYFT